MPGALGKYEGVAWNPAWGVAVVMAVLIEANVAGVTVIVEAPLVVV